MAFSSLEFIVRRREPELIVPAKPTPYEIKYLSDIDDRKGLRFHASTVLFYRKKDLCVVSTCKTDDIVGFMKKALAHTLVFYYPFAGRLREVPGGKLLVDLDQLGGDFLKPPFPCLEQLLCTPSNSGDIFSCLCWFIFGLKHNHTICDAQGLQQFVKALAEFARGKVSPSILPVWERHLLYARVPPQIMFAHREYDVISNYKEKLSSLDDMVHHSFFFSAKELTVLRKYVPPHLQACTKEEVGQLQLDMIPRKKSVWLLPFVGTEILLATWSNEVARNRRSGS
ncbi:hypothetical protein MKW98_026984 [Papaver atlanticum]|uniref:Uncharacterized protein n=1 Tax=Papaver atlanticum TaxID=357466 RepID=A0AAD4XKP1_9MAGN|nr:hypothetical protein MKW98_026984 [Papaver atlanticum]